MDNLTLLSKRFQNGLMEKHSLTLTDLYDDQYLYIGAFDSCNSLNGDEYLQRKKGSKNCLEFIKKYGYADKCVCCTKIKINCFVESVKNGNVLVLGSCCVRAFSDNIEGGIKMRCTGCNKIYKNALKSVCKECKAKEPMRIVKIPYVDKDFYKKKFKLRFDFVYKNWMCYDSDYKEIKSLLNITI